MKRTFIKTASKKVLTAAVLTAAILFTTPNYGKATPRHIEILSSASTQAAVQFAGSADNALYFNVKVANTNGDKFTVTVSDNDGNVLFSQNFNDKSFDKKFKLLKSDDISRYNFKISSNNKDLEQSFSVNASTRVVDDVVVTKL